MSRLGALPTIEIPISPIDAILLGGAEAALAASIFRFGEYSIRQPRQVMRDRRIPARL